MNKPALTKEDYKILTAWVAINPPNKPALRKPIQCIRLTTYEAVELECARLRSELEAAFACIWAVPYVENDYAALKWVQDHDSIIALAQRREREKT